MMGYAVGSRLPKVASEWTYGNMRVDRDCSLFKNKNQ